MRDEQHAQGVGVALKEKSEDAEFGEKWSTSCGGRERNGTLAD